MDIDHYKVSESGWLCKRCDRSFFSAESITSHLIHSSSHKYCQPCQRHFVSDDALRAHLRNSSSHEYCDSCGYYADDWSDICQHWRAKQCFKFCEPCSVGWLSRDDSKEHKRLKHPYACGECDKICVGQVGLQAVSPSLKKKSAGVITLIPALAQGGEATFQGIGSANKPFTSRSPRACCNNFSDLTR